MERSERPSVPNLITIFGGDLGKGSNSRVRARSDVRKAITNRAKSPKATKSKSGGGGSIFAEAWVQNLSNRARPAAANQNELFGRFFARPTPDFNKQ
jgi:hypothetical protein